MGSILPNTKSAHKIVKDFLLYQNGEITSTVTLAGVFAVSSGTDHALLDLVLVVGAACVDRIGRQHNLKKTNLKFNFFV